MSSVRREPSMIVVPLIVGVVVAAIASADEGPSPPTQPGRGATVQSAAQKTTVKKKARGRRGKAKTSPTDAEETPAKTEGPSAGEGDLKFSRDIAPILVNNCAGCHNATQKRGKLDMTSFETMMAGTPSEKVIEAGKPDQSHLVLRIKGEETPKMPRGNNRNLSDAAIGKIEQWVKAGALLDAGIDPKAPMEKYASSPEDVRKAELARMSPEQRDQQVETIGRERFKKANPKLNPETATSAHFLLFTTLPKERAASLVKAVEGQFTALKSLLGAAGVDWGEKASLYVFNDAGTFGEFVRTTESRDVEAGDNATARFNVSEPYVAVIDPNGGRDLPASSTTSTKKSGRSRRGGTAEADASAAGGDRSLAGVLIEQVALGATSRAGKAPRWVSLGLGAWLAAKVEPRSAYYAKIRRDAHDLWQQGWTSKANEALGDQTKQENVRAVGFAVFDWLASADRSVLPAFVTGMLAGGEKLDDVLEKVLNGNREQFLASLGEFVATRYER